MPEKMRGLSMSNPLFSTVNKLQLFIRKVLSSQIHYSHWSLLTQFRKYFLSIYLA